MLSVEKYQASRALELVDELIARVKGDPPQTTTMLAEFVDRFASIRSAVPLIDVGANIVGKEHFPRPVRTMFKARSVNIRGMVIPGYTLAQMLQSLQFCAEHSSEDCQLRCTLGIHPFNAGPPATGFEAEITAILRDPVQSAAVCAIGETGLDFDPRFPEPRVQRDSFASHIELALQSGLPLYIHERLAHSEVCRMLDSLFHSRGGQSERVCIHCFTGSERELAEYVRRGYMISLSGFVTRKQAASELTSALRKGALPLRTLMVESDAPYMRINGIPKRIRQLPLLDDPSVNEPVSLPVLMDRISEILGVDQPTLTKQCTLNSVAFFGFDAQSIFADDS